MIIVFLLVLSGVSLMKVNDMASLIDKMYKHPYAVGTSIREIQASMMAIHRSMKDTTLSSNEQEIAAAILDVNEHEQRVFDLFVLIKERYLGDQTHIDDALKMFKDWRNIREEVIILTKAGQKAEASAITKGKGQAHVRLLTAKLKQVKDFAENKARNFHLSAQEEQKQALIFLLIISVFTVFLSIVIARVITRSGSAKHVML